MNRKERGAANVGMKLSKHEYLVGGKWGPTKRGYRASYFASGKTTRVA